MKFHVNKLLKQCVATVSLVFCALSASAQEFSARSDGKDNLILDNGVVRVSLEEKRAYHVNGLWYAKGTLGNLVHDLVIKYRSRDKTIGTKGVVHEYHAGAVSTGRPRIIHGPDTLSCIIQQTWPHFKVTKTVQLFKGKPYVRVATDWRVTKPFDCSGLWFAPGMVNPQLDRLSFETPWGVQARASETTLDGKPRWFQIASFAKQTWVACHQRQSDEGAAVILRRCDWGGWAKICSNSGGGFWVSLRSYGTSGQLREGQHLAMEAYLMGFKGEPKQEVSAALHEILKPTQADLAAGSLVTCPRAVQPPQLDGKLDEACWQAASKTGGFCRPIGTLAEHQTRAYLAHDAENLYVALQCDEPSPEALVAEHIEPNVCADDCVEIFIDPGHDHAHYFHFVVNSAGTKGEEKCLWIDGEARLEIDPNWTAEWTAGTSVGKTQWTAEAAIPLRALGLDAAPKDAALWGFNLSRQRKGKGSKQAELSCWSPTGSHFHVATRFGHLALGGPAVGMEIVANDKSEGTNVLRASVENRGAEPLSVEVRVAAVSIASGNPFVNTTFCELAPAGQQDIALGYRLHEGDKCRLLCSVIDARSGATLAQRILPLMKTGGSQSVKAQVLADNDDCLLWLEGSTRKVFKGDRPLAAKPDPSIRISAAKGEYEPVQIVVRPKPGRKLKVVRLEFSDLTGPAGTIARTNIKYNPVAYIDIKAVTDDFSHIGLWPDELLEQPSFDADTPDNHPVWVTVYVPRDTQPGEYEGRVAVMADGQARFTLPLKVRVWNFAIPRKPQIKCAIGLYPYQISRRYKPHGSPSDLNSEFGRLVEKFRQNWLEHRVIPYWHGHGPAQIKKIRKPDGSMAYDFTEFDRETARNFRDGIGGFCIYSFSSWGKGGQAITEAMKRSAFDHIRAVAAHCEKKGWLEEPSLASIYSIDEPRPEEYDNVKMVHELVRRANPRLKLQQASYFPFPTPDLYGMVDIWIPQIHVVDEARSQERQALGEEVWWYIACSTRHPFPGFYTDHPAICPRMIFWMLWKYNVDGFFETSCINWHDPSQGSDIDMQTNQWQYNSNGLHLMVYPGKDGPVNSIRWELVREGIEDYDYLVVLKEKVVELEKLAAARKTKEYDETLAKGRELLRICDTFINSRTDYTKDPDKIYQARSAVGDHIDTIVRVLNVSRTEAQ